MEPCLALEESLWTFLFEPRPEPTQMFFSALALFLGALDFILLRFKPWPDSWVKIVNATPLPYGRRHPKVVISSYYIEAPTDNGRSGLRTDSVEIKSA